MPERATPGLLGRGWQEYQRHILDPVGAGAVQRQECRRAFYAGAIHLFSGLMEGLDDDHEPTPADLARMDRLKAEIVRYAADLKSGRA